MISRSKKKKKPRLTVYEAYYAGKMTKREREFYDLGREHGKARARLDIKEAFGLA